MSVALDSNMAGREIGNSISSLSDSTFPLTIGAVTDPGLLVLVEIYDSGTTPTDPTVTWNGSEVATKVDGQDWDPSDETWMYFYYLHNPTTGANGLTVDAGGSVAEIAFTAASFSGSHATAATSAVVKDVQRSTDVTLTGAPVSASGDITVDGFNSFDVSTSTPDASQTLIVETIGNSVAGMGLSYKASGSGTTSMSWRLESSPSRDKGWMGITVKQAGGATTNPKGVLGMPLFRPLRGPM